MNHYARARYSKPCHILTRDVNPLILFCEATSQKVEILRIMHSLRYNDYFKHRRYDGNNASFNCCFIHSTFKQRTHCQALGKAHADFQQIN